MAEVILEKKRFKIHAIYDDEARFSIIYYTPKKIISRRKMFVV